MTDQYDKDGKNFFGLTETEHELVVARVNISHTHDYDGSRRAYADAHTTSEALRNRRNAQLAKLNGHGSH